MPRIAVVLSVIMAFTFVTQGSCAIQLGKPKAIAHLGEKSFQVTVTVDDTNDQ